MLKLLVCAAVMVGVSLWIWRLTDLDPVSGREAVSPTEEQYANVRLAWIAAELRDLTNMTGISSLRPPQFANFGAHYVPMLHRVRVSRAMCARLDDADLRLILAHEVGHAARRWRNILVFTGSAALREELLSDRFAIAATGAGPNEWFKAVINSQGVEPNGASEDNEFRRRAQALGLVIPV